MSDGRRKLTRRLSRMAAAVLVALVFAGLVASVLSLPQTGAGLSSAVDAGLGDVGIRNPVSATLLDFRSYDTLLEIAVLLLAVAAIRALCRGETPGARPDDEVLSVFADLLVPVMIVVAGYLLAAGLDGPGGAFQAGAVLAAAGVLMVLSGRRIALCPSSFVVRLGLATGLAVFVAAGLAGLLVATAFLDHPAPHAATILTLLEVAVTVSVALTLLEMFVNVRRAGQPGDADAAPTERER